MTQYVTIPRNNIHNDVPIPRNNIDDFNKEPLDLHKLFQRSKQSRIIMTYYDIYMSTPLGIILIILRGYAHSSSMKLFQMSNKNGIIICRTCRTGLE